MQYRLHRLLLFTAVSVGLSSSACVGVRAAESEAAEGQASVGTAGSPASTPCRANADLARCYPNDDRTISVVEPRFRDDTQQIHPVATSREAENSDSSLGDRFVLGQQSDFDAICRSFGYASFVAESGRSDGLVYLGAAGRALNERGGNVGAEGDSRDDAEWTEFVYSLVCADGEQPLRSTNGTVIDNGDGTYTVENPHFRLWPSPAAGAEGMDLPLVRRQKLLGPGRGDQHAWTELSDVDGICRLFGFAGLGGSVESGPLVLPGTLSVEIDASGHFAAYHEGTFIGGWEYEVEHVRAITCQ
jgi:hypothetical protein